MTNSKDFLNKLENAYDENIKRRKYKITNALISSVIILSTLLYFFYIEAYNLLIFLFLVEIGISFFIDFKFHSLEWKVRRCKYVGQLSELFDLSHPVIAKHNEALIKEIQENKFFSGNSVFNIYCDIQNYEKGQESKFTINNTTYDKDYLNKLVEQNVRELEAFSN